MGANISNPRKLNGALNASEERGDPVDALPAKRCNCEEPWTERDPDNGARACVRCGRWI